MTGEIYARLGLARRQAGDTLIYFSISTHGEYRFRTWQTYLRKRTRQPSTSAPNRVVAPSSGDATLRRSSARARYVVSCRAMQPFPSTQCCKLATSLCDASSKLRTRWFLSINASVSLLVLSRADNYWRTVVGQGRVDLC